jgi:hypothetical protein
MTMTMTPGAGHGHTVSPVSPVPPPYSSCYCRCGDWSSSCPASRKASHRHHQHQPQPQPQPCVLFLPSPSEQEVEDLETMILGARSLRLQPGSRWQKLLWSAGGGLPSVSHRTRLVGIEAPTMAVGWGNVGCGFRELSRAERRRLRRRFTYSGQYVCTVLDRTVLVTTVWSSADCC